MNEKIFMFFGDFHVSLHFLLLVWTYDYKWDTYVNSICNKKELCYTLWSYSLDFIIW